MTVGTVFPCAFESELAFYLFKKLDLSKTYIWMYIDTLLSKAALWEIRAVLLGVEELALALLEITIREELAFDLLLVFTRL